MRVPLSKIYRAFPELNQFSDSECDRFCGSIYRQEKLVYVAPAVFVMLLGLAAPIAIIIHGWIGSERIFVTLALVVPIALFVALRTNERAMHQALRERICMPRCPKCEFSLMGLPITRGAVRCPECGHKIVLADHLLTPDDLLARPSELASSVNHREGTA